nr:uncharacterized protein LOC117686877 [Crassostrea gigas]
MASSLIGHSCSPRLRFVGKLDQGSIKFSHGFKFQLRFGLIMCEERFNNGQAVLECETSTTINTMQSTNDKFSKMAVTTTPVLSPSSVTRGHTPHGISTHGDPTFPITTLVSINNASTSITDSSATLITTRATSTLTSTVSEGHMSSRITPLDVTPTSLISENVSSTTNTDKSFNKGIGDELDYLF